jgi:hypothetical protein
MAVEEQYCFGRDIFGTQGWLALNQDWPSSRRKLGSSNKVFAFLSVFRPQNHASNINPATATKKKKTEPSSWAS